MCFFSSKATAAPLPKTPLRRRLLGFARAQLPYQLAFPANGIAGFGAVQHAVHAALLSGAVGAGEDSGTACCAVVPASCCWIAHRCSVTGRCWPRCSRCCLLRVGEPNAAESRVRRGGAALRRHGRAGQRAGVEAVGCAVPILVSAFVILYLYNGRRRPRAHGFYKWVLLCLSTPAHLLRWGCSASARGFCRVGT